MIFENIDIFDFRELSKEESAIKTKYWTFLVYEDSAPDNWLELLQNTHLPIALSPIHDKDHNPDGSVKKPHYHGIVCFNGNTTYKYANNIIQSITKGPIVKPCLSVRGMYRYFTHMDNPDKYQYESSGINVFNDFEVALSATDEDLLKRAICNIIAINQIYEYSELVFLLEFEFGYEYGRIARTNYNYFNVYVTSLRHGMKAFYARYLKYVTEQEYNLYNFQLERSYPQFTEELKRVIEYKEKYQNEEN